MQEGSRQWAKHEAQKSQGICRCSFSLIPFCAAMFTEAPSVPPPMSIGLLPKTLSLLSTLSTPRAFSVCWRHTIRPSISAFLGTLMLKYLAKDLASRAVSSLQKLMMTMSSFSTLPASVVLSIRKLKKCVVVRLSMKALH